MIRLQVLIFCSGLSLFGWAQQWCAPEATWTYQYSGGSADYREQYRYVGDTVLGGLSAQRIRVDVIGTFGGPTFIDSAMQYTAILGDMVMVLDASGSWDTLYWFGEPGDRWYPVGAPQDCAPYGMMVITDTGHVVIDDVSLRTWTSAYLDEQGQPMWAAPLLTERIGATPRIPWIASCSIIIEYYIVEFLCYSDVDIAVPDGVPCDITTMLPSTSSRDPSIGVFPNPGADQLTITGLSDNASVEVRDPLGRLVHSRSNLLVNSPIETASWESGTYFIMVTDGRGDRQVMKWLKQ